MPAPSWLTVDMLKSYVRSELTVDDGFYDQAIVAGIEWMENQTGRQWAVASASTARLFDSPGATSVLDIPDATAITVVVDNSLTLTVDTQYRLYPLNGLSVTGHTVPYSRIIRMASGYETFWLNYGKPAQISITATWGWTSIPPVILEACKIVAKDYFLQRDVAHSIIGLSDVGGVGTRENRLVNDAVNAYLHPSSIGVG